MDSGHVPHGGTQTVLQTVLLALIHHQEDGDAIFRARCFFLDAARSDLAQLLDAVAGQDTRDGAVLSERLGLA